MLGVGALRADEGHLFRIPPPDSLAATAAWKRLTITLAWLTPINPRHRAYRCAQLWFNPPESALSLNRVGCDWRATQRGTVQHDVFEGDSADAFSSEDGVGIHVNCREDAGGLNGATPYAIADTLETAPRLQLPNYEQIREKVHVPVRIAPE